MLINQRVLRNWYFALVLTLPMSALAQLPPELAKQVKMGNLTQQEAELIWQVRKSRSSGNKPVEKPSNPSQRPRLNQYPTSLGFNEGAYEIIKQGMTFEEVQQIIGVPPSSKSETDIGDSKITAYAWFSEGVVIGTGFKDGKLLTKNRSTTLYKNQPIKTKDGRGY